MSWVVIIISAGGSCSLARLSPRAVMTSIVVVLIVIVVMMVVVVVIIVVIVVVVEATIITDMVLSVMTFYDNSGAVCSAIATA